MPDLSFALRNAWLVPALPLFSFVIVGLVVRPLSSKASGLLATAAIFASAVMAGLVAWDYYHLFPPGEAHLAIVPWSKLAKVRRLPPVSMWRSIQTVAVPSSAANNASFAACLLIILVR